MQTSTKTGLAGIGMFGPGHLGRPSKSRNGAMRSQRMLRKAAEKERRAAAKAFRLEAARHGIATPDELDGRYRNTDALDWLPAWLDENPEGWQLLDAFKSIDLHYGIG